MPSVNEIQYPIPSFPRQLRIDSVTRCNAQCLSCHRHLSKRNGEMPLALINTLLTDVAKWKEPLSEIIPVNYGEFFLRQDWYSILAQIAQTLPYTPIVIPTNGVLLDSTAIYQLCKIPTIKIVNFSINAYFDETYEQFTKLPASNLIHIRRAVVQLKMLRPDILRRVSMVFDPMYQTDLERDLFINHWVEWAEPWILPAASAGRGTPIKITRTLPCRSIFSDIVVGYDGKLSSCCFDPNFSLDLGHYSGELHQDWHSNKFQEFRRIHNEQKRCSITLCAGCSFA